MAATQDSTPTQIVHIVVITAALCVLSYIGSLVAFQFYHLVPDEKVFEAFKTAGTSTMAFLFGMLVNTRVSKGAAAEVPDKEEPKTS